MPISITRLNSLSARKITAVVSGKTVTISGAGSIVPYGRFGNSYYNQSGAAWIEIAQHSDFAFGTSQDFTVEGWFYFGGSISNKYMVDGRPDGNSLAILFDGTYLKTYIAGAYRVGGAANVVAPNTWHHIAYTRSGTTGTLWWNGVSQGSWTDTTNYTHNNSIKVMSRYVYGQGADNSYCDEFRISKVARYTSNFTPNTTGFSGDSNTLLLLHMDSLLSSARTPKNITAFYPTSTKLSRAASKFGSTSLRGGSLAGLRVEETTSNNFNLGTGDYTVEYWVYLTSTTSSQVHVDLRTYDDSFNQTNTSSRNWSIQHTNATGLIFYEDGSNRITSAGLTQNTWNHVALTRTSGTVRMFVNGTQVGSSYTSTYDLTRAIDINAFMSIGCNMGAAQNIIGYLDEVRISNISRYSANFTPSSTTFVNDSNTLLLLHLEGAGSQYYDDASPITISDTSSSSYTNPGDGNAPFYPSTCNVATTTTSQTSTISIPTAATPGDILMLFDMTTTGTLVTPTGFTQITSQTTTGLITNVSYKIYTQADVGTTITGMAGTTRKVMIVYSSNSVITQVVPSSTISTQATTATPTNQTISISSVTAPVVAVAVYASTGSITTRGWTGGTPSEYSSVLTSSLYVKTARYNVGSTPLNATISMSDGGTNILQSFYFRPL